MCLIKNPAHFCQPLIWFLEETLRTMAFCSHQTSIIACLPSSVLLITSVRKAMLWAKFSSQVSVHKSVQLIVLFGQCCLNFNIVMPLKALMLDHISAGSIRPEFSALKVYTSIFIISE